MLEQKITNEPEYLLNNYLRLLYGPSFSKKSEFLTDEGFEVDWAILEAEQKARHGNLFSFLKLSNAPIFKCVEDSEMKIVIASYCDSSEFWEFKGRTLLENFCLYIYGCDKYKDNLFFREVAKVSGIISGLNASDFKRFARSPWGNKIHVNESSLPKIVEEEFKASIPLVGSDGKIHEFVEEDTDDAEYLISIKVIGKESTEIHSRKITNEK